MADEPHVAFAQGAARDGIELESHSFDAQLKGDVSVLNASRENLPLGVDLVHAPTGTVIAVDGPEHFTSFRLTALELYPAA